MKKYLVSILSIFMLFATMVGLSACKDNEPSTYTVTWKNYDGTVLETDVNVENGTMPTYDSETPSRIRDEYTYTFTGWDKEVSAVTEDVVYIATFSKEISKFTVIWKNYDGTVLETDVNVENGTMPTYDSETPSRIRDEYTYTFTGWDKEVSAVTEDVVYIATFSKEISKFTVIWKNYDGTVLETDTNLTYNADVAYNGETPKRDTDAQYIYTFNGWSPTISKVTDDMVYTAQYSTITNTYSVTWKNYDGTVLETDLEVPYGEQPMYNGTTPIKDGDVQYSYEFNGWTPLISTVTGNVVYIAQFNTIVNKYTITWKNYDNSTLKIEQVEYGDLPQYTGKLPVKVSDERYQYTFDKWSPTVSVVTGTATYTAEFTQNNLSSYTISYNANGGNNAPSSQTKKPNQTLTLSSTIPTKEGYTFAGWNNIYEETVYQAGSTYSSNISLTMFAMWQDVCEDCDGDGVISKKNNCSWCGGRGKKCNTCSSYNVTNYINVYGNYYQCSNCGSTSIGSCNHCGGSGGNYSTETCSDCNGLGYFPELAPTAYSIKDRLVTLTAKSGYEYSIDGINWQKSNIFDGLKYETTYTFYQRKATNNDLPFGLASKALTVTTKNATLFYVSYELDGGVNHSSNQTTYSSTGSNLNLNEPTKENYVFVGWFYNDKMVKEIDVTWEEDITLTAVWTSPSNYIITYDTNGGTNAPSSQVKIPNQSLTLSNTIPIREGYIFVGWNNLYEDMVYQPNSIFNTDLSLTLFAMWEDNCQNCNGDGELTKTICSTCNGTGEIKYYEKKDCSICGGSGYCYACESCDSSDIYRVISSPSYWVCRSCGAKSYNTQFKCPSCNNATLFTKSCTSCNGKGYHGSDRTCDACDGLAYTKDNAPTYQTISDRSVILTSISGYEYSMDGVNWQSSNVFENLLGATNYTFYQRRKTTATVPFGTTSAPLQLKTKDYAKYAINYTLDGGAKTDQQTYTYASSFTLTAPTKDGYKFVGWTGFNGNTPELEVTIPDGMTGAIEFTAHWEIITYTITYIDERNVENPNTKINYTVESETINLISLSDIGSGYSFSCWLFEGEPIIEIPKGSFGDKTITAKWISYESSIVCDEIKAISEFDIINTELFNAIARDTDNEKFDITIEIISGELKAGKNISIRLSATDTYSNILIKTLYDLKVYGLPSINYNIEKDYINLGDELTSELFSAKGMDSFGSELQVDVSVVEDSYASGDTISVKFFSTDIVGNKKEIILNNIRVYGEPEIFVNDNLISIEDECLNNLNILAQDTFGSIIDVESYPIWDFNFYNQKYNTNKLTIGTQKSFTISSSSSKNVEISFIALATERYTISVSSTTYSKSGAYYNESWYNTDKFPKDYTKYSWVEEYYVDWIVVDNNNTTVAYRGASGVDVIAGVEYTIKFSIRQFTSETKSTVTLYSEPRSKYPTYKATLTGSVKVLSETKSVDISLGNISDFVGKEIQVQHKASDKYGNTKIICSNYYVGTTPNIECKEKYNLKVTDEITIQSLGINATDTSGKSITNIELQNITGEHIVGSEVQYRVKAIDTVGNIATKDIIICLFGSPKIDIGVVGLQENSSLSIDELKVVSKDSFGNNLETTIELLEGQLIKGETVKIKFTVVDCVGNVEEVTKEMLVYSNEIELTYNKPTRISTIDFEKAFDIKATDCFGKEIKSEITIVTGKILEGTYISVKIIAVDSAGHKKESEIIENIKIYGEPVITFARSELKLYETDTNLTYLFRATDSFNTELATNIELISGVVEKGNTIIYKVTATDIVGNVAEEQFSLLVC